MADEGGGLETLEPLGADDGVLGENMFSHLARRRAESSRAKVNEGCDLNKNKRRPSINDRQGWGFLWDKT